MEVKMEANGLEWMWRTPTRSWQGCDKRPIRNSDLRPVTSGGAIYSTSLVVMYEILLVPDIHLAVQRGNPRTLQMYTYTEIYMYRLHCIVSAGNDQTPVWARF